MNWDRIEGAWKQRRGKAIHHWGTMMNDDLAAIAGKYEELVGKLQERYGIATERSQRHDDDFKRIVAELKKSNAQLMKLQGGVKRTKPTPATIASRTSPRAKRRAKTRR
jgi:uncharacterized protein YjbJ (UPF0337 family)